jgi:lysozyme family protein
MTDIKILSPFILRYEGGIVNDPDDRGGMTNRGVTFSTFKEYRKSIGMGTPSIDDLKMISDTEWTDILKKFYWDPCNGDNITHQGVANFIVDWAWGSGQRTATKQVQKLLGVTVDGSFGIKTLTALNKQYEAEFINVLFKLRKDFLINICKNNNTQLKFLNGWLNRLTDLLFYSYKITGKNIYI